MELFLEILTGFCLIVGCLMSLGAAFGIVRFPDVLARLHAGAKPQVFGLFMLLAGIALAARSWTVLALLCLIWVLQILAIPVSSHMVGRSGFRNKHFQPGYLSQNDLAELVERMNEENAEEDPDAVPQPGRGAEAADDYSDGETGEAGSSEAAPAPERGGEGRR
ncbi:monovalent cation/H(+) antiporter subunit G [Rothia halotolerans]|uniref:monovalent cation/H(+) antiporter subunit G n=1 Tax=Rothia halotolerans TaxID=405770 RepID=UPI00101DB6D6|nr:monovalent cation/H(+) antiporter subunit G [Rothia halotolerans]